MNLFSSSAFQRYNGHINNKTAIPFKEQSFCVYAIPKRSHVAPMSKEFKCVHICVLYIEKSYISRMQRVCSKKRARMQKGPYRVCKDQSDPTSQKKNDLVSESDPIS